MTHNDKHKQQNKKRIFGQRKRFCFDWDGVVVNSEIYRKQAWKIALSRYGIQDGDLFYTHRIGRSGVSTAEEAIQNFGLKDISPEELFQLHDSAFRESMRGGLLPIPSTIKFIRHLTANGIVMLIVSSQYRDVIQQGIEAIGLKDCFKGVISAIDDNLPAKPHPASYEFAARKLGVEPSDCVAVEDTDPGVSAAKDAGMYCIGFQNPESGPQKLNRADIVARDLNELI